eukprot:4411413-Alexandrium_andersonii.AAC.1
MPRQAALRRRPLVLGPRAQRRGETGRPWWPRGRRGGPRTTPVLEQTRGDRSAVPDCRGRAG